MANLIERAGYALRRFAGTGRAAAPVFERHDTALGTFYLLPNDALARHLLAGGIHEPHFHRLIGQLLSETDHVLDLGANWAIRCTRLKGGR